MIKNAVRCPNGTVLVFDGKGEQLPAYQGSYEIVKAAILRDTTPGTVFSYYLDTKPRIKEIPREEW
jgi:hypothetical protein